MPRASYQLPPATQSLAIAYATRCLSGAHHVCKFVHFYGETESPGGIFVMVIDVVLVGFPDELAVQFNVRTLVALAVLLLPRVELGLVLEC